MFGFGLKNRTAEAIRRGVRASLTGAYFHHSEVQKYGLNKSGSAWLLTEVYAHQFYALSCITAQACRNEKWATLDFFMKAALGGMQEAEKEGGMDAKQLASTVLKRYDDFEALDGEARTRGEHFRSSAILISKQDQTADIEAIAKALSTSTARYMSDVGKMFGV